MKCEKTFSEIIIEANVLIEQASEAFENRMNCINDLEALMGDAFSLSIDWKETAFVDYQANGGDYILFRTNDERGILDMKFELNATNWNTFSNGNYGTAYMIISGIAFGF